MSESVETVGRPSGPPRAAPVRSEDAVDALRAQVGELVLAHPGVHRLEPTLLGTVQLLGAAQGLARPASILDGVQLTSRGGVVDLDVSVATRSDHQARAAVLELHRQLVDLVAERGFVAGSVEISVLTIEETDV